MDIKDLPICDLYTLELDTNYRIYGLLFDSGLHPIHKLVFFPELLKDYLISNRININIYTSDLKWSPLMISAVNNLVKSTEILLSYNADVNLKDGSNSWSTLLIAIKFTNNIECIKLLLEYGANINFQEKQYGHTILSDSSYGSNNINIINLLLNYGYDITLKNKRGENCFDYIIPKKLFIPYLPYVIKKINIVNQPHLLPYTIIHLLNQGKMLKSLF